MPMETPIALTISALSSRFSADPTADSRLVEALFIPEQALTTVQKQAAAINGTISARVFTSSFPFFYRIALCSFPSSCGSPWMPLDSFVLDDTGGVNQRRMGRTLAGNCRSACL